MFVFSMQVLSGINVGNNCGYNMYVKISSSVSPCSGFLFHDYVYVLYQLLGYNCYLAVQNIALKLHKNSKIAETSFRIRTRF